MNDDLISREALKKVMWDEAHFITTTECGKEEACFGLTGSEIEQIIDNAPTVVKEKRLNGEWIRKEDVIHSIAKQYSEHNELVPIWLSIADIGVKDELEEVENE